eukprot:00998.XXX_2103_1728_1 [CDS] Oithona nana genome sequencing.
MKFIIVFTFATIAMAVMGSPPPTPTFNGNVMSLEDSEMEDWEMEDWEMILMSLIYQEYLKLVESKDCRADIFDGVEGKIEGIGKRGKKCNRLIST